jgi:hypothetical protein
MHTCADHAGHVVRRSSAVCGDAGTAFHGTTNAYGVTCEACLPEMARVLGHPARPDTFDLAPHVLPHAVPWGLLTLPMPPTVLQALRTLAPAALEDLHESLVDHVKGFLAQRPSPPVVGDALPADVSRSL